ncbi:MAG: hypothetical protein LBM70_05420 [Victivallales bacterium]|nr:hypothetical protein [Victivallales bacterium]
MKFFTYIGVFATFFTALNLFADAPMIHVDELEVTPTVKTTGKLLELRDSAVNNRADTPPGVLAALIADDGVIYNWTPSPDPMRVTGGADLIDAFIAPDESLLVLLENIGGNSELNATRILCFNLLNNKIVRAFMVENRKLAMAQVVPGSTCFIAAQVAQEKFKQKSRLIAVDLRTGKIKGESQEFEQPIRSLAVNIERSFVVPEKSDDIIAISHDKFAVNGQKIKTLVPNPKLLISPNGNRLVVYGEKRMELYNLATPKLELLHSRELPENFTPDNAISITDNASNLLFFDAVGKAYLYIGETFRQLDGKFTGAGCCRVADGKLFLGIQQKEAINFYQMPNDLDPQSVGVPGELRPRTGGRNFKIFVRTTSTDPELIVIDNRANIFELTVKPRRWQKRLIFEASK